MSSRSKLLCIASLLLTACSAEVDDESTGATESALMGTPTDTYVWQQNPAATEPNIAPTVRQIGVARHYVGEQNINVNEGPMTNIRPKFVFLSGSSPLTPVEGDPCGHCKR
jgi:hypothetical protein